VLFEGWHSFFRDRVVVWRIAMAEKVRRQLEEDVLPRFVIAQRWYGAKGEAVNRVVINDYVEWVTADYKWLVALTQIERTACESLSYFLPLALAWENGNEERLHAMSPTTVAKVRQQAKIGIIGDAFADAAFCRAVVQAIGTRQTLACEQGSINFMPTAAFATRAGEDFVNLPVRPPSTQGSNTAIVLGEQLFLKGYRHLQIGVHPEFEIGRFLTDVAHFPNIAPVFGVVEYQGSDGNNMTLALLQGYIENQGDCWSYTLDYLSRFLEECRTAVEPVEPAAQVHSAYLILIHTLGQRTGELHNALGKVTGDCAFDPESITDIDLTDWVLRVQAEAVATLELLEHRAEGLAETVRETAQTLLTQRNALTERLNACIVGQMKAVKTRYHGDFHLGQVLLSQNDFVFTDFEGEPARPFAERRHKHSPLRDVAGMLRSFNYAAHTALAQATTERPTDLAKFEPLVRDWEAEVGRVFLTAYNEVVPRSGDASQRGLLELFLLEKALYEVRYELDNRPLWVDIPLLGILSLLQTKI
jgi:maltose alpha-D-glucosyltransferase/alpha-amylase